MSEAVMHIVKITYLYVRLRVPLYTTHIRNLALLCYLTSVTLKGVLLVEQ